MMGMPTTSATANSHCIAHRSFLDTCLGPERPKSSVELVEVRGRLWELAVESFCAC